MGRLLTAMKLSLGAEEWIRRIPGAAILVDLVPIASAT